MSDSLFLGILGLAALAMIALFVLFVRIVLGPEYADEEADQSEENKS